MGAITFDTYAFVKKLEASGFEEKQAEALSDAIKETQEAHLEDLSTKGDLKHGLKELEMRLKLEIANSRAEIVKWCVGSVFGSVGLFATIAKLLG